MLRSFRRRVASSSFALLVGLGAVAVAGPAHAVDPVLRHQATVRGDIVVFGSTLAYDCGAGVAAPPGAAASCASEAHIADTAPDLYWRDTVADASILPSQARTSATLTLPPGAKVSYARLYWAALMEGPSPDPDLNATLDWLGGPQQEIVADDTWTLPYGFASHPDWYYYQSSGDATSFVAAWGAGDFRVTDVNAVALAGKDYDNDRAFSAWTLVVFYDDPADELRNLALFDGFTGIDPGFPGQESASVTLSGFLVPDGYSAKMAAFTYEGDASYDGDHFTMNGAQVADEQSPLDNFFNSSRSFLGTPVSGSFDVPKLAGTPGTMAGYDLDTIDVTSRVSAGDTSAVVGADSDYDIFFLGGFVTSITSLAPLFAPVKDVVDLNGGAVLPGDVLEYTIEGTNLGNDASADTVLTDTIESGLQFVPGSIEILEGGDLGTKTDQSGDDEAEYSSGAKTVTIRLGSGAGSTLGGSIAVGETFRVRFRVEVKVDGGQVSNQGVLSAAGDSGAPEKTWLTDGDPSTVAPDPTVTDVGQCDSDADCPDPNKPHCDLVSHTCKPCASDADCPDPNLPACQPDGHCGECSSTNDALCVGETPVCDTDQGICVLCTLGDGGDASICVDDPDGPKCVAGVGDTLHCGCFLDSDCGDPNSGRVCDTVPQICIDGCRGEGGNLCPDGFECTSTDTTIGECFPVGGNVGNNGSSGDDPGDDGGCACSAPGAGSPVPFAALAASVLGLLGLAARRRRR
jgi:uncharacterized repeat protein (TIGR01451 family)/MYXO-CTERM domain-containing protein